MLGQLCHNGCSNPLVKEQSSILLLMETHGNAVRFVDEERLARGPWPGSSPENKDPL
jgi:hypothetical protein